MDERRLAIELYNGLWPLMEKPERTPDEDALLIHQAHASLYHWTQVGEQINRARGEWMCSRVYSVLGRSEPALFHAARALELATPTGDWDLAVCCEAMARALLVAGQHGAARTWVAKARAVPVAEQADRDVVESDLVAVESMLAARGPSGGMTS
jgi:hypothetical protein